ncbi:hypothetical protein OQI_17115 [Streptomyces pharetrae CZA14]|uniref:Uncharacterized protein n=1 Tax=Streptomyces pharetrae CZA14 TaxID=1144883 RepID=A0ABX3YH91_9ACTN|nr:hypothetical protein OQI_17115 [Streptomyces pharetrae CZA14]
MGRQINVSGGPQGPGKPDTAVALARSIDQLPTKQLADTPVLIAQEQQLLVRCEAALENLRVAYWAAGKALQVIRDGRLYRATHGTFEDYCQEQWDITRQYANQLIRSWKIAEKLFEMVGGKSNDLERILSKKLGFGQAWELVALAEEHGVDAAALLYLALIQAKGMGVTAELVKGAAGSLPPGAAGKKKATEDAVLAYLASIEGKKKEITPADPYKALHRVTKKLNPDVIQAAMERNPDGTRTMVRELIEALSTSVGIEVEIKSSAAESAAA